MKKRFNYDAVVKDMFQKDRPTLLSQLSGGAQIEEFLNVEFPIVQQRIADLLILLSDERILHLDFQSTNHPDMVYREGVYGLLAGQKYRRKIRQVVIYMGNDKMTMETRLDLGGITVEFTLLDIRDLDHETLLATGHPGDLALAMLARGGIDGLRSIIEAANQLPSAQRQRVFTHGGAFRLARRIGTVENGVEHYGYPGGNRGKRLSERRLRIRTRKGS